MFTSEVGMYLKKIGNRLERGKNRRLKTLGLTGTQMEIMEYLHYQNGGECGISDIASYFDVKHTSVIHVIKLLEKKELIGRKDRKQGSRSRQICLTAEGEKIMEEMALGKLRIDRILMKDMTEDEKQVLQGLLQRAYENLKEEEYRNAESLAE